ncbi:MAG: energy transducer TonB [Bryobacteraceae bacterium]
MRLRLLTAAALAIGSLQAADPQLLSLAMPDTQIMAGMNVAPALLSPLGQFMLGQLGPSENADIQKLVETTGFDPRRDVQEILASFKMQMGGGGTSGIVLGRGTFDVPKLIEAGQASGGTVDAYKGVSIVQQPGKDGPAMAFPNSTLAIFGDAPEVRAAIDRLTAPTTLPPALLAEVERLSASQDIWVASMAPFSQFQLNNGGASAVPAAADPMALYSKVQQFGGGVKFGANVVMGFQVVSATEPDAAALAMVMKAAGIGLSGNSNPQLAALAAAWQSVSVTNEGKATKLTWSMPETQIEQMIKASQGDAAKAASAEQPKAKAAPAPLPPPALTASSGVPQRIRVGGEVQKAKLAIRIEPTYPPLAQQAKIAGTVRLNVIIGKDGSVQNLTVASGHPLLVPAAMEAVKQWVYEPTLLNGQPVEVVTQVEVKFDLTE